MSGECTQHSEMVAKLANIDSNVSHLKEDMVNVKKVVYEIRDWMIVSKAITTTIPIQLEDSAEFAIKKGRVTADLNKIDWKRVSGWAAWAFTFLISVAAYVKGGK